MLRLLAAVSIVFGSVVLAQAQSQLAPGPAAPGGPNPYGIGPGGTPVAPGSGGISSTPSPSPSVAPASTSVGQEEPTARREERRRSVERPSARRSARVSRHRYCRRCGRYGWYYTGGYYQWPSPYYAGGSARRYYNNYVPYHWGPPYVGGYLAEVVPFRVR